MDPPAKRLKISRPDSRSPLDTGSRRKEGLFTSELGTRSDETDRIRFQAPSRTIALSEMQRGNYWDPPQRQSKPVRQNAAFHLMPRVPDATITASVIEVAVDVGSTTLDAGVVAAATSDIIVAVSTLGSLTISAPNTISTDGSAATSNPLDSSQSLLTTTVPATSLPTDPSSASSTATDTALTASSSAANGNGTTTVTSTSTLEVSYTNGTFIMPSTTSVKATSLMLSHHNTLLTSTLSSEHTSNTAVFGSTGPAETTGASSGAGAAGAAATSSSTSSASPSSSNSGGKSSGPGLTPAQQQVVGGVVGGVAGIAVVLLVALVFLRWYRRRLKLQGRLPEQQLGATRDISTSGGDSFHPMSERSSSVPLAAAVASLGRKLRPHSSTTVATTATGATSTTIPESERGFQRIAGRKIAPVLSAGVDQYGGNYGAFEKSMGGHNTSPSYQPSERQLSGTSFYRDSGGFYGGKGSQTSPISPGPTSSSTAGHSRDISNTRDFAADSPSISASKPEGFAVLRPSPARTPATRSPSTSSVRLPIQSTPILEPDAPPTPALPPYITAERDAIGRSLASQDGSRVSRTSRGSGSRFSERI